MKVRVAQLMHWFDSISIYRESRGIHKIHLAIQAERSGGTV
jgi:hypothetical protein